MLKHLFSRPSDEARAAREAQEASARLAALLGKGRVADPAGAYEAFEQLRRKGAVVPAALLDQVGNLCRDMGENERAAALYLEAAGRYVTDEIWTAAQQMLRKAARLVPERTVPQLLVRLRIALGQGETGEAIGCLAELGRTLRPADAAAIEEVISVVEFYLTTDSAIELALADTLVTLGRVTRALERLRHVRERAARNGQTALVADLDGRIARVAESEQVEEGPRAEQRWPATRRGHPQGDGAGSPAPSPAAPLAAPGEVVGASPAAVPSLFPAAAPLERPVPDAEDQSDRSGLARAEDAEQLPPLMEVPRVAPPALPALGVELNARELPTSAPDERVGWDGLPPLTLPALPVWEGPSASPAVPTAPTVLQPVAQEPTDPQAFEAPALEPAAVDDTPLPFEGEVDWAAPPEPAPSGIAEAVVSIPDTSGRIVGTDGRELGLNEGDQVDHLVEQMMAGIRSVIPPEEADSHYEVGLTFLGIGRFNEAVAEFQLAFRAPESRLRAAEGLAEAFLQQGRPTLTIRTVRTAREMLQVEDERVLGLLYWEARAQEALGRAELAIDGYEQVLLFDATYRDAGLRAARLGAGPA